MHSEIQLITPDKAEQLLALNSCNRHVTEENVRTFEHHLTTGTWMLTHQGIAINKSGMLADGQHRLLAIVRTGIPAELMVTTDLQDEAFSVIDSGRKRGGSDVISIAGGKNATHIASAVRLECLYTEHPDKVWSSAVRKLSNTDILDRYQNSKEDWDFAIDVAVRYRFPRIVVAGPFACLVFLANKAGVSSSVLESLGNDLKNGANLNAGDPVLAYRTRITFAGYMPGQARLADYIKLLNCRLTQQSLKLFKQQTYPPMPVINATPLLNLS